MIELKTENIKYAIKNSNITIPQKGDAMRELSVLENEIETLRFQLKQANGISDKPRTNI